MFHRSMKPTESSLNFCFLLLSSSSALFCDPSEPYKLWDLHENKHPGREADTLTSRKRMESDQKHIEARVSVTFSRDFINGNPWLKIKDYHIADKIYSQC